MRILSSSFQHLVHESGLRYENANRWATIVLKVGLLRIDSSFVMQRAQPFHRFIWLSVHRVTHADHIKAVNLVFFVHRHGRKQTFVHLLLLEDHSFHRLQLSLSPFLQLRSIFTLVIFRLLPGRLHDGFLH